MSGIEGNRREFMLQLAALTRAETLGKGPAPPTQTYFENSRLQIFIEGSAECLWKYRVKPSGWEYRVTPPVFNIDGERAEASLSEVRRVDARRIGDNGVMAHSYRGSFLHRPELALTLQFRVGHDSPIIRFRYALESTTQHSLTQAQGRDDLTYLSVSLASLPQLTEVRLSNFVELFHSYCLEEVALDHRDYASETQAIGPIILGSDGEHTALIAYEHGSQVPEVFLNFSINRNRHVVLRAAKSNYLPGEVISPSRRFETVWFDTGAVMGNEDQLASAFRTFVLNDMSQSAASRKPYICYNTWNFQERNHWLNQKRYLDSMNDARILGEIDVAHKMGIEVFVLDAGWFTEPGDWHVSLERFPDGMKKVRNRLDEHRMKLGVWFGVPYASPGSDIYQQHKDCVMAWQGNNREPSASWESVASYSMCLVSRFGDAFADQMIRLARESGVTCFKWDAVEQYACDSPHHWHGDSSHSAEERANSYAFQLPLQMNRIVERLVTACPEAIVDFDVTERHRAFGLSFLAAGRYSLLNNGPYYHSLDIPGHRENANWNVYFYKGPARAWVCRAPLTLDRWIPSNLLLTHYYPDDPIESQDVNLASLVLGQNGIWGDLLGVSEQGVRHIGETLGRYRHVRDDVAQSDPVVTGFVSGSREIREKISARSGKGVVAIFAMTAGRYSYVTRNRVATPVWTADGASCEVDATGHAHVTADFAAPGAKILFFGTA